MNEYFVLIGQIFLISAIQMIMEVFVDPIKRPYHVVIINVAGFLGSLYLLLDFVFNNLFVNLSSIIRMPFF